MIVEAHDRDYRDAVADVVPVIHEIVDAITGYRELAHEEFQSSSHLASRLRGAGYSVTEGIAGMPTAFRAELQLGSGGQTVGLIAVYDAPASKNAAGAVDPVHSCGHGPQAAGVIGAAVALAAVREQLAGTVVIVGCPADEIHSPRTRELGSGKALAAARGVFDDIDVVLYPHPEFMDTVWPASLWMRRETATVVGVRTLRRDVVSTPLAALAAVSAISEAMDPATLIIESVSVDGDVEESAGMTFTAEFLVFGWTEDELGARVAELHNRLGPANWSSSAEILPVRPDPSVTDVVADAFAAAGRTFVADPPPLGFATDFGNVSQIARAAIVGVGRGDGWRYHTPQGAEEFAGPAGKECAVTTAEVLGLSVIRLGAGAANARTDGESAPRILQDDSTMHRTDGITT